MLAQPTLQMNVLPNIGDVVTLYECDTANVNPGNAGSNLTWDFSGLQPIAGTTGIPYHYLAPSSTPYAALFPAANFAVRIDADTVSYGYSKVETNQYSLIGFKNAVIEQKYLNPDIQFKAPLSLNGNFFDDYTNYTDASTGIIFYAKGSRKVTYDAYGTLVTPAGTFQNAMRLKSVSTETDSASYFGNQIINHVELTTYDWLAANQPGVLVSVYYTHIVTETIIPGFDTLVTDGGTVKSVNYIDNLVTAVTDRPGVLAGLTMQLTGANPASDLLSVNIGTEKGRNDLQLALTDVAGRSLSVRPVAVSEGDNPVALEVGDLPAGTYFLILSDGRGVCTLTWEKW